jgi:MFS family permease
MAHAEKVELKSWSFFGLAAVQFLTAFNDNTYRWLVVSIGYEKLGVRMEGIVLSIGLACFVLPYLLLAAPAGYIVDRFRKRRVIGACMLFQAAILIFTAMLIASALFWLLRSVMDVSAGTIFLAAGIVTVPVLTLALRYEGKATLRLLARFGRSSGR